MNFLKLILVVFALWLTGTATHAQETTKPSPTPYATILFQGKDEKGNITGVGTVELPDVSLVQVERGKVDANARDDRFEVDGQGHDASINVITKDKTIHLRGKSLSVEHHNVSIELMEAPYTTDLTMTMYYEWRGITRFRWSEGDFMGTTGFKESNFLDLASGVWEKNVHSWDEQFNTRWHLRYSGITVPILQAAFQEKSPRNIDTRIEEWGIDVFLPLHGAKVEILQADGWDIFPALWKDKKVPVTWSIKQKLTGKSPQTIIPKKSRKSPIAHHH